MGGPKRDLETYVKLIPPKKPKQEPAKPLLPAGVDLEEFAFGKPKIKNPKVPK